MRAPHAVGSPAPSVGDALRRLLQGVGAVLDAAQRATAPGHAVLRDGADAALASAACSSGPIT